MSNISVTTNQSIIDVTNTSGITVTTPEGQTIAVTVPNSTVNVTNTTDDITILTAGTLNINTQGVVTSVNGDTGPAVVLTTTNIAEGTNLYYTTARQNTDFDTRLATKTTTNLAEGTNLYYTTARQNTDFDARLATKTTDNLTQGATNKYFSQALARQSLSAGTGISYDNATGVITNTSINTNTTYTIDATTATGGANFNLVGSDATTDTIKFAEGTGITVVRTDADTITITNTVPDTNTTYTQNISSTSGGANLNLVGSDSTTDTVKFANGTGVTVAFTDADTATIAIGQSVGTGDSPSFAGITGGNITVGVATDNTIASTDTNGNITLTPNGSGTVIVSSDLAVNDGDITTTQTTASVFNTTATTLNIGGAATTTNIGTATGSSIVNGTNRFTSPTTYGFLGGSSLPNRGYMQSNGNTSSFATARNNLVVRSFPTATAVSARGGIIFENARGNETTPAAEQTNDLIAEINATGYATNGYVSDFIAILPGLSFFQPQETWANTGGPYPTAGTVTNAGMGYVISLQPTATTVTASSRINVMNISPQTFNTRSDAYNFNSKAGVTNVSIDSIGNMTLTGALDATTIEVTNIKAKDGTAALTIADSTGVVTVSTELQVDNINISTNTIASTDTNGNITLDPNGTGNVVLTLANGGNLTNSRNYVFGAIRNATTRDTNGDIWELNTSAAQSATNPYFRGVSVDNSADTTRAPGQIFRSYSGGAVAGSGSRGRIIFEKARGTAASTLAVQSGDILGSVDATGYSSTGWLNDTVAAVPAFFGFTAAENWVSNTALGTTFNLSLAPTATTITSGANLTPVFTLNPQTAAFRSDAFSFGQGKTGTANYLLLNSTSAKFATPVRNTITSATVAKGGTFTPAATAMNSIILEITAGSGTTTIDVSNLTVASENAVFDIMVYNNSGGTINSNALVILNSGNTALDHGASIANGARAMFEVNCVDIYANAKYAGDAV